MTQLVSCPKTQHNVLNLGTNRNCLIFICQHTYHNTTVPSILDKDTLLFGRLDVEEGKIDCQDGTHLYTWIEKALWELLRDCVQDERNTFPGQGLNPDCSIRRQVY